MKEYSVLDLKSSCFRLANFSGLAILLHALFACSSSNLNESSFYHNNKDMPATSDAPSVYVETESVDESILFNRLEEYRVVEHDIAMRGSAFGAVKGGLIGYILADAPGAAAGAFLGGAGGYLVSSNMAASIIREHKDYIQRRANLEDVLKAARQDMNDTKNDVKLLSKYNARASRPSIAQPRADIQQGQKRNNAAPDYAPTSSTDLAIEELRQRAEIRHIALQEVLPLYVGDQLTPDDLHAKIQESNELLTLLQQQAQIKADD